MLSSRGDPIPQISRRSAGCGGGGGASEHLHRRARRRVRGKERDDVLDLVGL